MHFNEGIILYNPSLRKTASALPADSNVTHGEPFTVPPMLGLQYSVFDLYSLAAPYFDFFAFLQLVAIFEPSVGRGRVSCGLAPNCELASLVHYHWIFHRF